MSIIPHHGQPGGFHCPPCVYLLRSPSAATRGKMGITCALSASNLAKYSKTSWVLVTLQRLAHTTPHVCIPHIYLHFSAATLQETRPFQAHSLPCHDCGRGQRAAKRSRAPAVTQWRHRSHDGGRGKKDFILILFPSKLQREDHIHCRDRAGHHRRIPSPFSLLKNN
jgi:hypothetical protein